MTSTIQILMEILNSKTQKRQLENIPIFCWWDPSLSHLATRKNYTKCILAKYFFFFINLYILIYWCIKSYIVDFNKLIKKKKNLIYERKYFLSVKRLKMPALPSTCPLRTITKAIKEVQPSVVLIWNKHNMITSHM